MVLVLSYRSYEQGTDPVIEWLSYYGYPFKKLNLEQLLEYPIVLDPDQGKLIINGIDLQKEVGVVFYRRFSRGTSVQLEQDLGRITETIKRDRNLELSNLVSYMLFLLGNKKWLPHYDVLSVNKQEVLKKAAEVGLDIPQSIVTNDKTYLKEFIRRVKRVIYKPLEGIGYYTIGDYTYSNYTTEITRSVIKSLPDLFFPSLFQELVEAEYEVRSFYIDGDIYSSAILRSQFDPVRHVDVKLDFDRIETDWVNYELPQGIQDRVRALMVKIGLNTGSIDIIRGVDGRYYFIEVNPVGQYLAPSALCNYHLEKRIAEWLIEEDQSILQS